MPDVVSLAQRLAAMHESGDTVVLPTVWDVWSARLAVEAGAAGLTVGSHPVADSLGRRDGENMDFAEYLGVIRRIASSVEVPVSADAESGYGFSPAELVEKLIDAGAVGANIEDVVHRDGKRVRGRQEHADFIAACRQSADSAGVQFVINGRTDAVKLGTRFYDDPIDEAAKRIELMEAAGARAVYPVGLTSVEQVSTLVAAASVPLNVTAHPVNGHGAGDFAELQRLGVRRVSFGPLWQKSLSEVSQEQLSSWFKPSVR